MLPEIECIVFDSERVDALTLTSKNVAGRAMIAGLYNAFAEENDVLAYQKPWGSLGYKGYQAGSVRYGRRLDGSALFSSGDDAMLILHQLLNNYDYDCIKTTRVDICTDVALRSPKRGWLRALRDSEEFKALHVKERRQTTLIEGDTGDTLYIGSRVSGRFGRIYDKSAHYGVDLGSVYRFELETKKQVAPALFSRLFPECKDSTYNWDNFGFSVRQLIQAQFGQWGVGVSLSKEHVDAIKAEVRVSTLDTQLSWLSRTVAPVLQRLEQQGYKQESMEALGFAVPLDLGD